MGLTVDAALAALMNAIESAIDRGADRLEVVHGKGTGRVKHAVHQRLGELAAVQGLQARRAQQRHYLGVSLVPWKRDELRESRSAAPGSQG